MGSRRIPFPVYAASLLVVVLGASAAAQNDGRATRSNIAIDNFGCVNENYYRGAQPKGRDYADLATLGVKTSAAARTPVYFAITGAAPASATASR